MCKLYARFVGPTLDKTQYELAMYMERVRRRQEIPPQLYSILPFSLFELPGTTWRNAHTAHLITVHKLGENRYGRLGPDPGEHGGMFSIGLWRDVGFCIEHWVRIDLLPADEQIVWAEERVAFCRRELVRAKDKFLKAKRSQGSITYARYEVEGEAKEVERARQELTSLCQEFGVGLQDCVLNIGIQPGEQIAMF